MNYLINNAKKLLVLLLALVASFALVACGDDEVEKELKEALASITLGDVSDLSADLDIRNVTNKHELAIKWELENTDNTLKLERKNDDWTTIKVFPSEYTEDENGKQTNTRGEGVLKAIVEKDGKSADRTWDLGVVASPKTVSLTIAEIKEVDKDTGVEITATVTYLTSQGFYITDNSGSMYVFLKAAPAEDVKPGAEVFVKGKKDLFYGSPQIIDPIATVVTAAPSTGYDFDSVLEEEIGTINQRTVEDLEQFGKATRISGYVIKDYKSPTDGTTVSQYAIQDTKGQVAAIYNSSTDAVKAELEAKVGEYVSLVIITDGFHSTQKVWRHYAVDGTVKAATAPVLSDEEIIAAAKSQIIAALSGKSFAADINLPTEGVLGGTITWVSSNTDVVSNTGVVTLPSEQTEVTLTYTITSSDKTEEGTLKVTILSIVKSTVKEAIDIIDEGEQIIMVEGVIIGQDSDGYYYLADETGVLFVRHKLADDNLVVGNKVRVTAKGTVYNRTSEYTRQVNGDYAVVKLDNEIHASPLAPVAAELTDFDFTITKENMGVEVPKELLFGKVVTFEAFVVERTSGTFTDPYLAVSTEAGATAMVIHHKSVNRSKLTDLVGKKITVTGVIYSFNSNSGWRFGFMDRDGDIVATFTEAEKLALAKTEIETVVTNDKAVSADLDFFTDAKNANLTGVKYTWSSNNTAVIANDGKFTAPAEDTDVVITVKVFLDGNTEGTASATHTYTVKAKAPGAVVSTGVIISQAYGGGGNSGATLKSDFIELYNTTDEDIDLTGWVVWYASKTGLFKAPGSETYDTAIVLSGTIKAKGFYLIKAADGEGGTVDLPTPDATTGIAMGGTGFKLALTNSSDLPVDADSANVVDFVGSASNLFEGSGAAPAPSNTTAIVRADLTDTDDNAADFTTAAPNPRNSSYTE